MQNGENQYCSASNLCDTCECDPIERPQKRDESRDVWVHRDGYSMWCDTVTDGERYVPHSQLESATKPVDHEQPQKRDESRDLWVYDGDLGATDYLRHSDLNERNKWIMNGERYVPHAQFVAAHRDSELLDAIIKEFTSPAQDAIAAAKALSRALNERFQPK